MDRFASVGIIHWEGGPLDTDEMMREAVKNPRRTHREPTENQRRTNCKGVVRKMSGRCQEYVRNMWNMRGICVSLPVHMSCP
jgi:hypothetical protein